MNETIIIFLVGTLMCSLLLWWLGYKFVTNILHQFTERSHIKWDNYLSQYHFFKYLTLLIPIIFMYIVLTIFHNELYDNLISKIFTLSIIIIIGVISISFIKSMGAFYEEENKKIEIGNEFNNAQSMKVDIPTKGYVSLFQLVIILIISLLSISIIYNVTLWKILSGVGAASAILLFILKDTLLSFSASVQLLVHKMAGKGDWVEVKSYGADGIIENISLYYITIRNWDNSITNIPMVSFVESSFKNWQRLNEKESRRIMRSVKIDMDTIEFLTPQEIQKLKNDSSINNMIDVMSFDSTSTTNLNFFMEYLEKYLYKHEEVMAKKNDFVLVRQLEPTAEGLPIQIYTYTTTANWIEHERIQSEIMNHVIAIMPKFNLSSFQLISSNYGYQRIKSNI